jgi:hypothetical protein
VYQRSTYFKIQNAFPVASLPVKHPTFEIRVSVNVFENHSKSDIATISIQKSNIIGKIEFNVNRDHALQRIHCHRTVFPCRQKLQVQPFRLTFSLRLENPFPSTSEILHLHSHPSLSERQQTCFCADGLDIRAGQIVLLVDEFIKLNILTQRHLGRVERENLAFRDLCRIKAH